MWQWLRMYSTVHLGHSLMFNDPILGWIITRLVRQLLLRAGFIWICRLGTYWNHSVFAETRFFSFSSFLPDTTLNWFSFIACSRINVMRSTCTLRESIQVNSWVVLSITATTDNISAVGYRSVEDQKGARHN